MKNIFGLIFTLQFLYISLILLKSIIFNREQKDYHLLTKNNTNDNNTHYGSNPVVDNILDIFIYMHLDPDSALVNFFFLHQIIEYIYVVTI